MYKRIITFLTGMAVFSLAGAGTCATEELKTEQTDTGFAIVSESTKITEAEEAVDAEAYVTVEKPLMTLEEYPRIDGSLACIPLCEALAKELTGCSDYDAEDTMANFTNTNPCYQQLKDGLTDLILAYEAADETKAEIESFDQLNLQAVGKDALVFVTNEDNPVESLTVQQIYDIYTGRITNWSEVGGNDEEIKVFSRPEKSGSQTLMRKLLIGDADMIENAQEIFDMEGIIRVIREYDNSANAIGFSVYYYASEMFQQPGLKFLSIDGVAPSRDTIRREEYPLTNAFYCGTAEGSSENALKIQKWLMSCEGQKFVEECGYVPAHGQDGTKE